MFFLLKLPLVLISLQEDKPWDVRLTGKACGRCTKRGIGKAVVYIVHLMEKAFIHSSSLSVLLATTKLCFGMF